ncbi:hypothetical protein LTR15_012757 [Elasticomyces elasticus]|nr:hypothetical protein LTR15_012757 [Elasticomyces elasticus]
MPTVIDLTEDDVIDLTADDTPPLFNKLTPEIRATISHQLLATKYPLRKLNDDCEDVFNASLLYVSRQIRSEAMQVFYYSNTFQLESTNDLHDGEVIPLAALPCLRRLELLNEPIASFLRSLRPPQHLAELGLASLINLPKLQTVTLAYDQYAKSGSIISNSLQRHGLLDMFEWTDIGLLTPKAQTKTFSVTLKHFGLSRAWRQFVQRGRKHDHTVQTIFAGRRVPVEKYRLIRHATKQKALSLTTYLELYEGRRQLAQYPRFKYGAGKKLKGAGNLALHFDKSMVTTGAVPKVHAQLHRRRLGDVDASRHSPELIQWASELLTMNEVAFHADGMSVATESGQLYSERKRLRKQEIAQRKLRYPKSGRTVKRS